MADSVIKRGDTGVLRFSAYDEDGLIDLPSAESIKIFIKEGTTLIEGPVEVIDPPEENKKDPEHPFNGKYTWQEGDTDIVGDSYECELEIIKDSSATPPDIETVPNEAKRNPTLAIDQDLA